jgi:AhpD family alkylhydroperoxidase
MRLDILDHGHRLPARMFFGMTRLTSGVDMSDVPKTLLYRPEFFGRPLLELSATAMRGPSYWTAGEREYLAMVTAGWHRCPYCAESHAEMVRIAGTGEIDAANPDSARPELRAVLGFLETVSRTPDQVAAVAGVPAAAVLDALRVNVVWNIVNRLANAFGFQLRPGQLQKGTRALHRFGYRFPGFLTGGVHKGPTDPIDTMRACVLEGPGATDPAVRQAAATAEPLPEPWPAYATLVRDASYRVTDADIARLKAAGHTEDEIFEVTVAAAVGAALRSYDAGLRLYQP